MDRQELWVVDYVDHEKRVPRTTVICRNRPQAVGVLETVAPFRPDGIQLIREFLDGRRDSIHVSGLMPMVGGTIRPAKEA